jgi:flagellar hook-associated protein 3 FlgL
MSQIILAALKTSDQAEQTALQQLTSGRRVNQASDDPAAAAQEVNISSQINGYDQYTRSISSISSELQTADSSLNSAVTALQDRNTIAQQVQDVSQLVLGVANLSYNGVYVFGGTADSQPPYVVDNTGTVQYQGNNDVNSVEIAPGQSVAVNKPGSQLFSATGSSVFTALSNLATTLQDSNSTSQDIGNAVTGLRGAYDQLTSARTFYGSTVDQLASTQDFLNNENVQLSNQQNSTIGVDMNAVVTNLSQAEQARAATVEAAAGMNNVTLMDYLSSTGH